MPHPLSCPYSGRRDLARLGVDVLLMCRDCGSRLGQDGDGSWALIACPSDDRKWVARFLPALRRMRHEMRPGGAGTKASVAGTTSWDAEFDA
jgi:hypothetical protein